ncbi:MAG: type II secretion system F family protein [Acidimicrobiales bacterium]|nr:type II secretion system F family protein [Acidimicrobiales bacterium]
MTAVMALVAAALVGWASWRHRPAPARARRLGPQASASAGVAGVAGAVATASWVAGSVRPAGGRTLTASRIGAVVESLGRALRARLRRPPDPAADRHLGRALVVGVPAALVSPLLAALVVLWWWATPMVARRRASRRLDAALLAELPEVVDLFVLAVGSGLTVALAVPAVARHHRGLLGEALVDVARQARLGRRLGDALADLPDVLGERVRPLATVLVSSERYGVALLPALERLAAEARLERRRAAEATARRVPVKLLFPLVLCTLPAFALLTVVPLLAGSLRSLRL